MSRKVLALGIVVALALAVFGSVAPVKANPASFVFDAVLQASCNPGDYPQYSFRYEVGPNENVNHVWTLTNARTGAVTGPLTVGPFGATGGVVTVSGHVPLNPVPAGTLPTDTLVQRVEVVGLRGGVMAVAEIAFSCGGGCELPIPSTAVVGQFNDNTSTYWLPGHLTSPVVVIEVGNTAWVLGVDASGAYYKIIWACQYLWVPVGNMGPNFDDVWQGTPLPTGVVE
jgi:hypothetical protein